jgi:high affinity Mn2+ porin
MCPLKMNLKLHMIARATCSRMAARPLLLALFVIMVLSGVSSPLCRARDAGGAPVAPTTPGLPSQPGRPVPVTQPSPVAPATQPTTAAAHEPQVSLGSLTIPIAVPILSGNPFNKFTYTFHGQATTITQGHGDFPALYSGTNSQTDNSDLETSYTGTLFTGVQLVHGTEIYFDPEVAAGQGIGGVLGIANFPNGEISHVGTAAPTARVARLFLRQTFGFGGEQEDIPDGQDQVAVTEDINRLTFTIGEFSATDIFDNNTYAHDPRTQFLNLGLVDDTAWDFPADTYGYTEGAAVELNGKNYTARYGVFREPSTANGDTLDSNWLALGQVVEFEQRYTWDGHPGAIRPMGYFNVANMGNYQLSVQQMPVDPVIGNTASYSNHKYGFGFSFEQELTPDLGLFARAGWNNGQSESWAFTEVDRMGSLGISLKGASWSRPDDVVGLGGVISGISGPHADYLAAGGLGFILGDGQLKYAPEEVLEVYYMMTLTKNFFITADYQFVNHPGYNADRGPISIGAFRFHFEF